MQLQVAADYKFDFVSSQSSELCHLYHQQEQHGLARYSGQAHYPGNESEAG